MTRARTAIAGASCRVARVASCVAACGALAAATACFAQAPAARTQPQAPRAPAQGAEPLVVEAQSDGVRVVRRLAGPRGWQPGAPLALTIEATGPAGTEFTMPTLPETLGPFEVRVVRTGRDPATGAQRLQATLTAWEAGELPVPEFTVTATLPSGATVAVTAPAGTATIESLLSENLPLTELAADLRGPVEIPGRGWLWWLAAGVGIATSLGAAWWLTHRGGRVEPAPPLPADQWAMREIDRLESEQLPERGEVEGFFVRLSDIVRTYIEQRFAIAAPEQTTQEFIRAAGKHPDLAGGHERTLAAFLRTADMVKFAAQRPAGTECGRALDAMRGFVRATAPPHEAPAEGGAATPPVARATDTPPGGRA
ncbi:MAG: hypothetical protein U0625_07770 [Phycisphaerales bacterium]